MKGDKEKKTLKSIPTSRFARGMRLARLTASVGAEALTGKVSGFFADAANREIKLLVSKVKQAQKVAETLGQLKGAAMKLGQIFSLHGEHLFPKEVVEVLARLQSQSDELAFEAIARVARAELGDRYAKLENLSERPIASASIGQVHAARYEGKAVAVKIQYPGVDKSIDSDVDSLASILSVLTRVPSLSSFNAVVEEIKVVLHQETDYLKEGQNMELFREAFSRDTAIVVPRYFAEVSTRRVLTAEFVDGISVQEFAASTASDEARAFLGGKYLEVLYREIFEFGYVQTDPNFANYKIRWAFGVQEPKLVLLDFGAVKIFSEEFRRDYAKLAQACLDDDYDAIREWSYASGILREGDSEELAQLNYELVKMIMEPFRDNRVYAWRESDLPERIRRFLPKVVVAFKLRPPPPEFIFLNRKIVGVYFFCSAIGARFNPRPIIERFIRVASEKH